MKTIAELKKSATVLNRNELKSLTGGAMCWSEMRKVIDHLTEGDENSQAQAKVIIEGATNGSIQYDASC